MTKVPLGTLYGLLENRRAASGQALGSPAAPGLLSAGLVRLA